MPGTPVLVVIALVALGWAAYFLFGYLRRRRRDALRSARLAPPLLRILENEVPLYRRLPVGLQTELIGHINVFLADKAFIGCDGLSVTDEMRVVIAGNACVLLLGRGEEHFEGFSTVLVYPDTYLAPHVEEDGEIVTEGVVANAGESWHGGPVVLSWADVQDDLAHPEDGSNVVLHEFAHKLDEQNGVVDGLPELRHEADYRSWPEVLGREFGALTERARSGGCSVLDSYGATSPAEFFAVATEAFFERGRLMREALPALYVELGKFYGVDPASWKGRSGESA